MRKLGYGIYTNSSIDNEVLEPINLLHKLVKSERVDEPVVYGKYIRVAFVLVARSEKIETILEPHVRYVKLILKKYYGIRSVYTPAAGKNVTAARAWNTLIVNVLKAMNTKPIINEYVYDSRYKDASE